LKLQHTGVIEGFYGRPWTRSERLDTVRRSAEWGFSTYFYAPKDDPTHRQQWREDPSQGMTDHLGRLARACEEAGVRLVYALAPGLSIDYSSESDVARVVERFAALHDLGCGGFALLFDDIPSTLDAASEDRFGSLARAQAEVCNEVRRTLEEAGSATPLWLCPTEYCAEHTEDGPASSPYLRELGEALDPEVHVFWTGSRIVPPTVTAAELCQVAEVLKRKPTLWDNFFANDYDPRRVFMGPLMGREPEALEHLAGCFFNPNTEHAANTVPLTTASAFLEDPQGYRPDEAFGAALSAYKAEHGVPRDLDLELVMEFAYTPFREGPRVERILELLERGLEGGRAERQVCFGELLVTLLPLHDVMRRLPSACPPELLPVLSHYLCDLPSELVFLFETISSEVGLGDIGMELPSPPRHKGTFRGGFVNRLMRLLPDAP